jgi:putative phosphoribosyl transferase
MCWWCASRAEVIALAGVDEAEFARVLAREQAELARREQRFRGERSPLSVAGRAVIVVDDGVATGATLRAGLAALRELGPARLVAAVPVAPVEALTHLEREADEVVCLFSPDDFVAVGAAYRDFDQTSDEEVRAALATAAGSPAGSR